MVVVAGVERDPLLGARRDHAADDVERAIAVERRDLDRDDVVERGEARPERRRQIEAADRRLQVEADQRQLDGDGGAMVDDLLLARALPGGEAQQGGVVAEAAREARLGARLLRPAAGAGDEERPRRFAKAAEARPVARGLRGDRQHLLEQAGLADRELGRVDADGEAAGTGVEVVARQGALAAPVEPARRIERERMGRDREPVEQALAQDGDGERCRIVAMVSRTPGRRARRRARAPPPRARRRAPCERTGAGARSRGASGRRRSTCDAPGRR